MSDQSRNSRYVQIRFERLVKLSREIILESISSDAGRQALRLARLYGDLLAKFYLDGAHNPRAEQRMLLHVSKCSKALGAPVNRRLRQMFGTLASDVELALKNQGITDSPKKGVISQTPDEFSGWRDWLNRWVEKERGYIVAVMSRAITDASVASRLCGLPVRCIGHSRKRLNTVAPHLLDSEPLTAQSGQLMILLDAHSESGATLHACWSALESRGTPPGIALITCDDTPETWSLPHSRHYKYPGSSWGAFENIHRAEPIAPPNAVPAPIVALCGYPGSGKTLVRQELQRHTRWLFFSWARPVRRLLLEEFGGISMDAVRRLTREEIGDPEIVARESLVGAEFAECQLNTPVVIDGIKSIAALRFLQRHLGRPTIIANVFRTTKSRRLAIQRRAHFDDSEDLARTECLDRIGLGRLLTEATLHIDASDSDVDPHSGVRTISSATMHGIQSLICSVEAMR